MNWYDTENGTIIRKAIRDARILNDSNPIFGSERLPCGDDFPTVTFEIAPSQELYALADLIRSGCGQSPIKYRSINNDDPDQVTFNEIPCYLSEDVKRFYFADEIEEYNGFYEFFAEFSRYSPELMFWLCDSLEADCGKIYHINMNSGETGIFEENIKTQAKNTFGVTVESMLKHFEDLPNITISLEEFTNDI